MAKYQKIQRFVPNYGLKLEERLQGIYEWENLRLLYLHLIGHGNSAKAKIREIAGEEIKIINGVAVWEPHFNLQKRDLDELNIINKIKTIKETLWERDHILIRPYSKAMILLDKGSPPSYAQLITTWNKRTHIDSQSPLGRLIFPEMQPIELTTIGKIKRNKKGHIILNKKEIIYEIDENNHFLKAKKVGNLCHNLRIATFNHLDPHQKLFMVARCKGYVEYQTIPVFISEQSCELVDPDDI